MTAEEFYKDHFGHTSQHVSMDKIFVCMELYAKEYANKRVIEELEKLKKDGFTLVDSESTVKGNYVIAAYRFDEFLEKLKQ